MLDAEGIAVHQLRPVQRWRRPLELRRFLTKSAPDAVLAFQEAPSFYAELAGIVGRRWGLVVSERRAEPGSHRGVLGWIRIAHRWADAVTANSAANRALIRLSPGSRDLDVHVIYNAVNLKHFVPASIGLPIASPNLSPLRLVVLASHQRHKNLRNVLEAILHLRGQVAVQLGWYGGPRTDRAPLRDGEEFIRANGLGAEVALLPAIRDPRQAYWASDAVLLASFSEGCPNVICEAMACGKPVLASAVSDNPLIIEDGVSGFLLEPHSPAAIAASIAKFAQLSSERRQAMGAAGRRRAEALFDPEGCAKSYEALLAASAQKRVNQRPSTDRPL